MKPAVRLALAAVWLTLLIACAWLISQRLLLSGDLRKFMPGRDGTRRKVPVEAARAAGRRQTTTTRRNAAASREVFA